MTRRAHALVLVVALAASSAVDAGAQGGRGGGGGGVVITEPTPPSRPSGTALILGRAVDGANGAPIGGVTVTLAGVGSPDVVLADTDGRFVFRDLARGTYTLTATKRGWGDGAYGRTHPDGSAQTLEVADGAQLGDVQVPLWKLGAISGTITDERGEPVVGVDVRALARTTDAGRPWLQWRPPPATTDDRGVFRLAPLPPGEYTVVALSTPATVPTSVFTSIAATGTASWPENLVPFRQPGVADRMLVSGDLVTTNGQLPPSPTTAASFNYPTTFLGNATSPTSARVVVLTAGQELSGADLQLTPVRTSHVAGVVTGTVASAPELLLRLNAVPGWTVTPGTDTATTVTASDGRFQFPAVPAGDYMVTALRVVRGIASTVLSGPPPEACYWTRTPVSVGDRDIDGLNVPLAECPLVRGRVEFDGAAPHPTAEQIRQIIVLPLRVDTVEPAAGTGQANADGHFAIGGAPPGQYRMHVSPPTGWALRSITLGGRDVTDRTFELDAGGIDDAVITLTDRLTEVTGNVTVAGAADASAAVLLFPNDTTAWVDVNPGRRLQLARADRTGRYRFSSVPAGDYYIVAVPDATTGDWQSPMFLSSLVPKATSIRLAIGDKRTVGLQTIQVSK